MDNPNPRLKKYQIHKDLESEISKFKNGKERFQKSASLNTVINMLIRGVDPITIIDVLVEANDELTQLNYEMSVDLNRPIKFTRMQLEAMGMRAEVAINIIEKALSSNNLGITKDMS